MAGRGRPFRWRAMNALPFAHGTGFGMIYVAMRYLCLCKIQNFPRRISRLGEIREKPINFGRLILLFAVFMLAFYWKNISSNS